MKKGIATFTIILLMSILSNLSATETKKFSFVDLYGNIFNIEVKIETVNESEDFIFEIKEEKTEMIDIKPFIKVEKEVEEDFEF